MPGASERKRLSVRLRLHAYDPEGELRARAQQSLAMVGQAHRMELKIWEARQKEALLDGVEGLFQRPRRKRK